MTTTLALLVFTVDHLRLGIELGMVDRAVRACEVTPLPGAPSVVIGAINLHGTVVPVIDLRQRLNLPARAITPDDQFLVVLSHDRRYAVPADEIEGMQEFAPEALVPTEELADGAARLRGAVRLSDGLLLIEDPRLFLDVDGLQKLAQALREGEGRGG